MNGETLLEVDDLRVSFRTGQGVLPIVEGVSFVVKAGEILSVVGESGSGKSLTALAIMRLITDPNAVITGSVRFRGQDLLGLPEPAMRSLRGGAIAMIFQDPMTALTPAYTVGAQIVEQIMAHRNAGRMAARTRAIDLLGAMGIASPRDIAGRYPHQLSGGMRQRVMIAMALSCDPALLIADEPTTALDVTVQAQILELILRLRGEFGSSVLLITHDMGVVAKVADRVVVMYAGAIAEAGATRALFARPAHPYTIGLLGAIPRLRGPRLVRLPAIPGAPPAPHDRPSGCGFAPRCAAATGICAAHPPLITHDGHAVACFHARAA
ncbi:MULTISPECIES: ABC transporter ATP-binding protein [Acidiphilium]|uniref:Nickel import system ATP-binding protein NikD n=1 Tax=Acidiphilium rubrum TaxID=526 RepID=A0A8G2FLD5_ACIRU|nr:MULTISPECIES: ABC transporter ATP-binding protein [Acidiphilium]MBW4036846.1 ABC transporter ATP-binding protein [Pseudomonadota bacterium]SIQ69931.1 peptide/nickel transport system ATP-binding protein [Acidiphilium rubrum]